MAKASDNAFPSILLVEQGAAPATPAANQARLYRGTDNTLHMVDETGATVVVGGATGGSGEATWTAPTLQNSWVNYGGSGLNAGFRKDGSGVVHLRGIIKGGAVGSVAFTLPAGYRPPGQATYAVPCANAGATASVFGSVNVNADGTVLINGATAWTYLDGITFYTD